MPIYAHDSTISNRGAVSATVLLLEYYHTMAILYRAWTALVWLSLASRSFARPRQVHHARDVDTNDTSTLSYIPTKSDRVNIFSGLTQDEQADIQEFVTAQTNKTLWV